MIDYTLNAGCSDATPTSYAACERWAHADRLGSVVSVSDSTGAMVEEYKYSPYGVSGSEGNSGFPFRFTGQRLDPATGLYFYKARFYDPEIGRFLQTDPIGYEDQMNLYAYVGNDPVSAWDPDGLCSVTSDRGQADCRATAANYHAKRDSINAVQSAVERGNDRLGIAVAAVATTVLPGPEDAFLAVVGTRIAARYLFAARGAISGVGKGKFKNWRTAAIGGKRNPNGIRFTQDSINGNFKDGRSVDGLIDDLKSGKPHQTIFRKFELLSSTENFTRSTIGGCTPRSKLASRSRRVQRLKRKSKLNCRAS